MPSLAAMNEYAPNREEPLCAIQIESWRHNRPLQSPIISRSISRRPFHFIRRRVNPFGAMRNARTRTRRMLARSLEGDTRSGRMSAHSPDGRLPFVVVGGGGGGGGGAAGKTRGQWPHGTRGNKRRALPGKSCSCFLTSFGISKFSQEEPSASPQGKLFAAPTPLAFLPCLHRSLPSPHNITVMSEWSREC